MDSSTKRSLLKMENCFSCVTLLLLVAAASPTDVPPNNFWHNPAYEAGNGLAVPT